MSVWTARLLVEGARTAHGELVDRSTLESLAPLLSGVPICVTCVGESFDHPPLAGSLAPRVDPEAIVGSVREVCLLSDGLYGLLSIAEPSLDRFFLAAERRGRLVESPGLSVRGRALALDRDDGEVVLWFTKAFAVDVVEEPLGGGCLLQSDAAAAAGAPLPALPKIAPAPRPARESSRPPSIRYAHTEPRTRRELIATELSTIPPGGDYPPWQ